MSLTIVAVREVTSELVTALASLLPQLNPALVGPSPADLNSLMSDSSTTILVASVDTAIVATATVIVYRTPAWVKARIEDVVVDEGSRGHGIGEALINECLNVARRRGARVVELQSASRRLVANHLYARMGFERRQSNVYRMTLG